MSGTEIAIRKEGGLVLSNTKDLRDFATVLQAAKVLPQDVKNIEDAMVRIAFGYEVGLAPMQSIQNISNIRGKLSMWGDSMIALVQGSPVCEYVKEYFEGEDYTTDGFTAVCECKRRDRAEPTFSRWSVSDNKKAGLNGKGVHAQYPKRMLAMRARSFGLRDTFPDVLRGMLMAEEVNDYPETAFPQPAPTTVDAEVVEGGESPVPEEATPERKAPVYTEEQREMVREAFKVAGTSVVQRESILKSAKENLWPFDELVDKIGKSRQKMPEPETETEPETDARLDY